MRRRRPRQHIRKTRNRAVMVNNGIVYDDAEKSVFSLDHQDFLSGAAALPPEETVASIRRYVTDSKSIECSEVMRLPNEKGELVKRYPRMKWQLRGLKSVTVIEPDHSYTTGKIVGSDLSGRDLHKTVYHGAKLYDVNFAGANLDESEFYHFTEHLSASYSQHIRVSFRNASLRNASFQYVVFGEVDIRGADLAGANFVGSVVSGRFGLDVTDSNISSQQIAQLRGPVSLNANVSLSAKPEDVVEYLTYRRYMLQETADMLGVTPEDMLVDIWAGDIEVRDHLSQKRVVGEYDKTQHHIPQWEVQRLLESAATRENSE